MKGRTELAKRDDKTRLTLSMVTTAALEDEEYFHGFLPREDLTALLLENGDFLVRLSEPEPGEARQIVLSMMYDKGNPDIELKHIVIHTTEDGKCQVDKKKYLSVPEMIETHLRTGEPITNAPGTILRRPIIRQPWELSHDDITLVQKIGEGAFGEVHRGKLRLPTRKYVEVAIKIAKTDKMTKEKIKEMMKEARLMRNYNHPNIVKIYGVAVEHEPLMIIMEFITGGALDEYLRKNGKYVDLEEKLANMCAGASWGIEYLHYKNCIHRVIAARNCLYTNRRSVKISDFGLSRKGNTYQLTTAKKLPIRWLSPETLSSGLYTQKSDVYSFGIMVWEIFSNGSEPYEDMGNGEVQQRVLCGYRMEFPRSTPKEVADMILTRCWDANPDKRWNMYQVAREFEAYTNAKPPPETVVLIKRMKPIRLSKAAKKVYKNREKSDDFPLSLDDTIATVTGTAGAYTTKGKKSGRKQIGGGGGGGALQSDNQKKYKKMKPKQVVKKKHGSNSKRHSHRLSKNH
ncbi:Tyrosine-protein kinase Fps85D [Toxocara canis]|uniref:Tyrosine-protein kinase n=1 Tax=Toxocara canis TaxID=6265 RepID=A0A0B2UYL6_TOXCA|nr:Tyrosine-protein kinase Fps85D [Toxocara canis]